MDLNREEITRIAKPFLIVVGQEQDLATLVLNGGNSRNEVVRVIRGDRSRTKQDFFSEISAALQFPYYFGDNWDAFEECINDLSWLPAERYLLYVSNAEQLLSMEPSQQFEKLISILERAAKKWAMGVDRPGAPYTTEQTSTAGRGEFAVILHIQPDASLREDLRSWLGGRENIPQLRMGKASQGSAKG